MTKPAPAALLTVLLCLCMFLPACATVRGKYYDVWERAGYAKRERLVDDVKEARDAQNQAKEDFTTALEQFRAVVQFDGGDLDKTYARLNKAYEKAESRAEDVHDQIADIENVGKALFKEWDQEIKQIEGDEALAEKSRELYDATRASYQQLLERMHAAAATMAPVLTKFRNRVLFLKHNLNARAIASLEGVEVELGEEIANLISEMEASIAEADAFIETLGG